MWIEIEKIRGSEKALVNFCNVAHINKDSCSYFKDDVIEGKLYNKVVFKQLVVIVHMCTNISYPIYCSNEDEQEIEYNKLKYLFALNQSDKDEELKRFYELRLLKNLEACLEDNNIHKYKALIKSLISMHEEDSFKYKRNEY